MLSIEEVTPEFYATVVREPYQLFGSAPFNKLNEAKVDSVYYLLFKDSKYRVGLIAGKSGGTLCSPFSAPFGGFTPLSDEVRLQAIEAATDALTSWCREKGLEKIRITLPPPIYNESYLAKVVNVFYRTEFRIVNTELNFHFDLLKFNDDYPGLIWRNARKNLNQALANSLRFRLCDSMSEKEAAYEVIRHNRSVRGKPLRLSLEQLLLTTSVIPADFFLVTNPDEKEIASAIVFTVAPAIAQVIYWGDIPDFAHLKTMNFLSYKIFEYYKSKDFRYLDIGYSTEDSVPNYGLCEFKESIGCDLQPKLVFEKVV